MRSTLYSELQLPRKSPNNLVRERYQEAQSVIQRDEKRKLTQREFLDVAFGNNPKTGKPYNPRTLRKWMNGERSAAQAVEHSKRDTWAFQQYVSVGDQDYGVTLTKPSNRSGLDLFKPKRRRDIKRAAKERLEKRAAENISSGRTAPETKVHKSRATGNPTIEIYRPVVKTRGMQLRKARGVKPGRAGVIITRSERIAA